ncbi:hypothetical protein SCARD494_06152 [Seiridium cardinale]
MSTNTSNTMLSHQAECLLRDAEEREPLIDSEPERNNHRSRNLSMRKHPDPKRREKTAILARTDEQDIGSQTRRPKSRTKTNITSLSFLSLASTEPEILANGPPSAVIRECPGSRALKYPTLWYRYMDEPTFLACSHCHQRYIDTSELSHAFLRFHSEAGVPLRCRFWVPRISGTLWPDAGARGNLEDLTEHIKHRVGIPDCKGLGGSKACERVKWYQPSDERSPKFLCCQACYEDRVLGTNFDKYFVPSCKEQPEEEVWTCGLTYSFLAKTLPLCAQLDDWHGFKMMTRHRSQLRPCKGQPSELRGSYWFSAENLKGSLWICESCYLDRVTLTPMDKYFQRVPEETIDYFKSDGTVQCGMSIGPIMVAFESAIARGDVGIFLDAAEGILGCKACSPDGIDGGFWYTIYGDNADFFICEACYLGIMAACEMDAFFRPARRDPESKHLCHLNPAAARFLPYVEKLAEAVDVGDFSVFSRFVRGISQLPDCSGREPLPGTICWSYGDCTVCPECFETTVSNTMFANCFEVRHHDDSASKICSLGSIRMRQEWAEACQKRTLEDFAILSNRRSQTYSETIPIINSIKRIKLARTKLGVIQFALDVIDTAVRSDTIRTKSGGNLSPFGRDLGMNSDTENKSTAASVFEIIADANREDEWRTIRLLESRWEGVE